MLFLSFFFFLQRASLTVLFLLISDPDINKEALFKPGFVKPADSLCLCNWFHTFKLRSSFVSVLSGDTQDKVHSIHVVPVAMPTILQRAASCWPLAKHMTNCELKVIKKSKKTEEAGADKGGGPAAAEIRGRDGESGGWKRRKRRVWIDLPLRRLIFRFLRSRTNVTDHSVSFFHPPFLAASPHFLYQLFTHLFHFWSAHFCITLFLSASLTIFFLPLL